MENQKIIRAKIYEFAKSIGAVINDENKKELKTLLTEYKDHFLNLQKDTVPAKKAAPKETWKPYSADLT